MWRGRVDEGIKRALLLTILVVVVAKLTSLGFDAWMENRQEEIVDNQKALSAEMSRRATEERRAEADEARERSCRALLARSPCQWPKDFSEAGQCLIRLGERGCDQLADVHLCAAVESLELCSDGFEDQGKNGCDRLRRRAQCARKPAPAAEDREGLWEIVFDDGLWHGEAS